MNKPYYTYIRSGLACLAIVLATLLLTPHASRAVPYASGVVSNNNTVTFILNQNAQGLVVLRDGGNPVYPGTNAGQLSFDMTGYTSFQIIVTGNTTKAWTQFIPDGTDRNFYFANSVAINKNPKSANFGQIYIANNSLGTAKTGAGRTTPDGIYLLRPDGVAISGPNTGGVDWTTDTNNYSRPYKINLNPDDNLLYVSSYFDDTAYVFNGDLSVATPLIDASNKSAGQYVESIYATGSQAAGNRMLFTVNSHYADGRVGLIGYNLGSNATATPGDTGSQVIGPDFYSYYPGDIDRDSKGNWYVTQYRATAGQASAVNKFDGSLAWPINTSVWDSSKDYTYIRSVGVNEAGGTVAVGRYLSSSGLVYFFDLETGAYKGSLDIGNYSRDIAFDVAGNMVSVDNSTEYARFWSPGGFTVATTKSDGTFNLSMPDSVSVAADVDAVASEQGADPATFTISRTAASRDLQIYFTLGGTATSNVDYTVSVSSGFTFKAGETSTNITITPIDDSVREGTETVVLTLGTSPDYYATDKNTAVATIIDNDAVVRYWDANGAQAGAGADQTGTWGTDSFWSANPDGTAATTAWQDWAMAVFSAGADWGTFTVTVNGTQKVDGPSIEEGNVTLSGGTILLTNFSPVTVAMSAQGTINSVIGGGSGLTKEGPGTLILGGANTYTGPTTINDGILQLGAAQRIPDLSAVKIGGTGTLDLYGYNETVGSLAGSTGAVVNASGVILTFGGDNTDTVWDGTASSGGTLVKVGTGTARLGLGEMADTLEIRGGTMSINAAARLGSANNANNIALDNGAILESTSPGVGDNFVSGRPFTMGSGGGTLKVTDGGAILMVHDASVISGPGTLTKDGPGEVRTYSVEHSFGKLIVKAGLYTAGHSTSLGYNTSFGAIPAALTPDAITIMDGASIRKAGGANVTLDPKQGITLGGRVTFRAYAGNTDTGTFEIPSPIIGAGPLVLGNTADVGAVFILSGPNTYTGGTVVNAGITEIRADGALSRGDVTVASGATLRLTNGTANTYINAAASLTLNGTPVVDLAFTGAPNPINALYIGGVRMASGTWGAVGSGAAHESALFTGTGMLSVTGSTPQPVSTMGIASATGGNLSISYSGGTGSQFVLLQSTNVAAQVSAWARVATNTAASGTFTIVPGTDPTAFYRIQSE